MSLRWSGTPRRRCLRVLTSWWCPADFPMAIICAAAPSPRGRRSWTRCARSRPRAASCSGSAMVSRSSARPACCPACSCFTRGYNAGQVIRVPVAHGEGNYEADEETLKRLEGEGRVLYRYCSAEGVVDDRSNVNGAAQSIAGIVNERGNVLGMMPHPENHVEDIMGCTDGRGLFAGLMAHLERAA